MLFLPLLLLALPLASATYFTSPQKSTVWSSAAGQTITWKYQAGGASNGDVVLEAVGSNPKCVLVSTCWGCKGRN